MAGSGGVRSLGRPGRAGRCGYCHDLTTCPQQGMAEKQTWLLHRRRAVLGVPAEERRPSSNQCRHSLAAAAQVVDHHRCHPWKHTLAHSSG